MLRELHCRRPCCQSTASGAVLARLLSKTQYPARSMPTVCSTSPPTIVALLVLLQAADSHPAWRQAFDRCSPSIKASMLIKGDRYYQRLHRVIDMGLQEQLSPSALLNGSDSYFETRIAKATAKAAAKPDARAAAVAAAAAAAAQAAPAASDTPLR